MARFTNTTAPRLARRTTGSINERRLPTGAQQTGQLIRNTYGGAIGGPVMKNRLYFFFNYEGQRSREAAQVTENVPSDALRQGILQYYCDSSDPNCSTSNSVVNVQEVAVKWSHHSPLPTSLP